MFQAPLNRGPALEHWSVKQAHDMQHKQPSSRRTAGAALETSRLVQALRLSIVLRVVCHGASWAVPEAGDVVLALNGLPALAGARGEGPHVGPVAGVVVEEAQLLVGVGSMPAAGARVGGAPQHKSCSSSKRARVQSVGTWGSYQDFPSNHAHHGVAADRFQAVSSCKHWTAFVHGTLHTLSVTGAGSPTQVITCSAQLSVVRIPDHSDNTHVHPLLEHC
jgi:hypothetical protein